MEFDQLPGLNAILNSLSAVLLMTGYVFIRRKNMRAHRACMIAAFITSTLFLISYVIYHLHHGTTHFQEQGLVRAVYLVILGTHTILAIVIVPFALTTLYRATRGNFASHRRVARWTLPMWLYVSVTGVVVYLMLYQFYPAR